MKKNRLEKIRGRPFLKKVNEERDYNKFPKPITSDDFPVKLLRELIININNAVLRYCFILQTVFGI